MEMHKPITTTEFYRRLNAGKPAKPISFFDLNMGKLTLTKGEQWILQYDKAIAIKALAACEVMKLRQHPFDKYGWGGQFAYDGHLNELKIKRLHDDPFYSPTPDICDFHIRIDGKDTTIEVKTTRPSEKYKELRVYKTKRFNGNIKNVWRKPDFIIPIKCLNEEMTTFRVYGWLTWHDVEEYGVFQDYPEGGRWGIPLTSKRIKPYSKFLEMIQQPNQQS